MMKLEVFDPAMCCSSGVCGPDVDAALVQFAADLKSLTEAGATIRRYNLAQEPAAFTANPLVRRTLQIEGVGCLPLGIVGGEIAFRGRYPMHAELTRLLGADAGVS